MINERKLFLHRLLFFAGLAAIYGLIFLYLCQTPFFDVTNAHNDRLFSADDVYYVKHFYASVMDDSVRIIKHPLLVVFGWLFTRLEGLVFGAISLKRHYALIVCFQLCLSLLSTFYLERILRRQYGMRQRRVFLLCAIYALAFSTLFYTFVAESYIISSLLLLMTFYYARRQNAPMTVLLGVLAAGTTITNAFLWAIIAWLADPGSRKRRLAILFLSGICFCIVVALSPARDIFYANIISSGLGSAHNYSDHFGLLETLTRVFFIFFGSTAFYLHTALQSPFGDFAGDALSFLPSASFPIGLAALVWLVFLIWSTIRARKDPLLRAPLGVLGFNLLLHGVIQYGLKEGFLYSLHHLPAQILIIALAVRPETPERPARITEGMLWCYLVCEVVLNIPGYLELIQFIS